MLKPLESKKILLYRAPDATEPAYPVHPGKAEAKSTSGGSDPGIGTIVADSKSKF